MRYVTPDLEGNDLAYKGRRFWVVDLAGGGSFQGIHHATADYVIYDRFGDVAMARVMRREGGGFRVRTVLGFAGEIHATTLKEAARAADWLMEPELNSITSLTRRLTVTK